MHKNFGKILVALPKNLWYTVINLCNSHKALPALKGDMREASKELDRFHKKAYNYIQARKLVKQLEYYTHWETIFESESAAAEA